MMSQMISVAISKDQSKIENIIIRRIDPPSQDKRGTNNMNPKTSKTLQYPSKYNIKITKIKQRSRKYQILECLRK
jgi:hypothetical protein